MEELGQIIFWGCIVTSVAVMAIVHYLDKKNEADIRAKMRRTVIRGRFED